MLKSALIGGPPIGKSWKLWDLIWDFCGFSVGGRIGGSTRQREMCSVFAVFSNFMIRQKGGKANYLMDSVRKPVLSIDLWRDQRERRFS